jgi:hypothetical protein
MKDKIEENKDDLDIKSKQMKEVFKTHKKSIDSTDSP